MNDHTSIRPVANPSPTREQAYTLFAAGITAGLPAPMSVNNWDHYRSLDIRVDDDDPSAVHRWAAHLGLPTPTISTGRPLRSSSGRWFTTFGVDTRTDCPALPGWHVKVESFITVDAPAEQVTR